ncbi:MULTISPECIES: hypothetical protein [Sphingomonas]|uniref:hypothetical protein n=1 Tax=Sphingomonas TaxID=13687 RepID=UPI000834C7A4|nr:hypothetical protein [Sphingomonas sp. CCH10-B3]
MTDDIRIFTESPRVEALLAPYRAKIGGDYAGYRNHILRVLSYAMHFLGDDDRHLPIVETALAFHDLGMWSHGDLAYLEPSIAEALATNDREGLGHDPVLLAAMIREHHKLRPYHGPGAELVNAVRKADWIDASGGVVRKGVSKAQIARVTAAIPVEGFPRTLMRLAADLAGGNQLRGLLRVVTRVYRF